MEGTKNATEQGEPPMSMLEDISDRLAKETLEILDGSDDDTLQKKVADTIGNSSPTLQEAYNTAMRIRRAEIKAIEVIRNFKGS